MDEIYRHHLVVNEPIKRKSASFQHKPIPGTATFTVIDGKLYVTYEYWSLSVTDSTQL